MKPWVIYHKKTGAIRGMFRFVNEKAVNLQIRPGEAAIEGTADPLRDRVEKGKVVACARLAGDAATRATRQLTGDMSRACGQAIRAGFYSSALGAAHFYRNRESDQLTRLTALTLEMSMDLPCTDTAGNRTLRRHSPTQVQAVCRDQLAWITACHRHLEKSNADRGVTNWTTPSTDHAEADQ
ncbi:hypothetical protein U879_02040 [Defluviimonas sp. 20V17]|uniref:Uncharacterized protein n=1 Tax=Allgaiera indica TaxID=765699 RepID=A0AAN4UUT5_9RHOB|nr:hypothetical protein [Allgaiera indica]KDB05352.1 hypothetical protein U879_02040 [Defluviimonas sp. 20V17]GHE04796.1 hypothetical protein GCM10008024_33200 [Allgaiera indica]SDX54188.1 hypothetical protein SAMN05444006_11958 [Allgaiera indica]